MHLPSQTVYHFRGESMTLKNVRKAAENELGVIIDKSGIGISARVKVYDTIMANREAVLELLQLSHGDPDYPQSVWED